MKSEIVISEKTDIISDSSSLSNIDIESVRTSLVEDNIHSSSIYIERIKKSNINKENISCGFFCLFFFGFIGFIIYEYTS